MRGILRVGAKSRCSQRRIGKGRAASSRSLSSFHLFALQQRDNAGRMQMEDEQIRSGPEEFLPQASSWRWNGKSAGTKRFLLMHRLSLLTWHMFSSVKHVGFCCGDESWGPPTALGIPPGEDNMFPRGPGANRSSIVPGQCFFQRFHKIVS